MRSRLFWVIIPAGALLAILPLLLRGPSCGDDFQFHLRNWLEVGAQWKQGVLLPRWDFTSTWNSGEPRFVFYPPLSWSLGALLGLILPWAAVPAAFIWLTLCACGSTMYRLAREWTGATGALVASCFFMVNPYMLFTFMERTAFAEFLAAAWIPLLLLAILRPRISIPGIAIPVALLWLTNDPAAVMGCYSLALLALVRVAWLWAARHQRRQAIMDAARATIGVCLGLALSGFYLIPAIVEQGWVHIILEDVPQTSYPNNFLFGHVGSVSHVAILHRVSLSSIALILLIAAFAAFAMIRRGASAPSDRDEWRRLALIALLILAGALSFLLTSVSAPLWRLTPELKFLQFPWRFDAVLGSIAATLLALAFKPTTRFLPRGLAILASTALLVSLIGGAVGNRIFRQYCGPSNSVSSILFTFERGVTHDPTDEYTPLTSLSSTIGHNNPPAWIADAPGNPPPQTAVAPDLVSLKTRLHFTVTSPRPAYFVINLRNYPAWRVTLNGNPVTHLPHRTDGLIVVPIPAGKSVISIRYAVTPDLIAGSILTLLAAALLLAIRKTRWLAAELPDHAMAKA